MKVGERFDLIEARTRQNFTSENSWTIGQREVVDDDEKEIFTRLTIKQVDLTDDIKVKNLEAVEEILMENSFYIKTDQELHPVDWNSKLFR